MFREKSENIKNFLSVVGANFFVMFVGIVQSFIFPKFLSPNQYGIWALYLLYVSYAGLFNLGVSDGIYLIYGGEKYDNLDKKKFKSYLNIVVFYLLFFLIIWSMFHLKKGINNQTIIMLLIGISSFLACLINFTTMIDQATSRFNIYSKGHIIEKIFIMLGAICLLIWQNALIIIIASIIGRLITVIYYFFNTKPILFSKHSPYKETIRDIRKFSFYGIWVTLAAICTTSMTGIGRFFVENNLGITQLGYYSFVLSISGLFTIFFSAIATVLFPMLRQSISVVYKKQIDMMDSILDIIGFLILLLYYPSRMILELLYPQYYPAFDCLIVLFPLVLLQGRTTMIHFTIFKVERYERLYVYSLLISIVVCICLCSLGIKIYPNIISIAISTYIAFLIWNIINTMIYNRKSKNKLSYHLIYLLTAIFFLIENLIFKDNLLIHIVTSIVIIVIISVLLIQMLHKFRELKS